MRSWKTTVHKAQYKPLSLLLLYSISSSLHPRPSEEVGSHASYSLLDVERFHFLPFSFHPPIFGRYVFNVFSCVQVCLALEVELRESFT